MFFLCLKGVTGSKILELENPSLGVPSYSNPRMLPVDTFFVLFRGVSINRRQSLLGLPGQERVYVPRDECCGGFEAEEGAGGRGGDFYSSRRKPRAPCRRWAATTSPYHVHGRFVGPRASPFLRRRQKWLGSGRWGWGGQTPLLR